MSQLNRRVALKSLGAIAISHRFATQALAEQSSLTAAIQLGVIADLHGGLAVDAESRLDTFLKSMHKQNCHALLQLGDFAYPNADHQVYADKFNAAHDETIHVIGNHEFDHGLARVDCYKAWGLESSYYRRDVEGLRIIVLDGNEVGSPAHRGGYPAFVGKQQQEWLSRELEHSDKPVLVLSHQPLAGTSAIDNARELQQLLANYRAKIVACLNGHSHVDSLLQIEGVPYLHVNSASYYWVGGRTRMAYYSKPLFTTVTIDPKSATVSVAACPGSWQEKSPKEIGYFEAANRPPESIVVPEIRSREIDRQS